MSDYKWEEILRNCVTNGTIKSNHLQHIPKLKDCENWRDVIFLGRVKYSFKYTSLDGALIKRSGKIYYINNRQIMALAHLYKWETSKEVKVID